MKPLKVMTVVGTRPEIIRLSAVIERLEESKAIHHVLVHTGQNYDYELNQIFFDNFKLKQPDYFLEAATSSAVQTIGNILLKIDPILASEEPDALLILGDTNSALSAIAAKRRHIPIFHMEAGNRSFDQRVPEETNRKMIDHIADINLTYSDIARHYLLAEGLPADQIIKTGSPMFEVLTKHQVNIEASTVLDDLELVKGHYFVVSAHREENIDSESMFLKLVYILNTIADHYQLPVIVSTHPRTRKRIKELSIEFNDHIKLLNPLGFYDYNQLQINARAVLSDSGTISEESSILKFKALNIREAHERPEAMEEASVMMVGLESERVIQALEVLESQDLNSLRLVADYSMPNVSEKVLRILLSYTDYIQRKVWRNN